MLPIELWFFFTKERRAITAPIRKSVGALCRSRNWNFVERPAGLVKVPGRQVALIAGDEAESIYRRMHRALVGMLCFQELFICLDPRLTGNHLRERSLVKLRQFGLYKSFFFRFSSDQVAASRWSSGFEDWCGQMACEGEHDPRCLPLHVFSSREFRLEDRDGRLSFAKQYGAGSIRRDEQGRTWELETHGFHAGDSLHVAGYPLRVGFHWHVAPPQNRSRATIITTTAVWEVSEYVNVAPDAHVRGDLPHAKQIFPSRRK